jgi:hypothetical protein
MPMQAWLDQEDAHVRRLIRRHGWFIQYVGIDDRDPCDVPGCQCADAIDGPTPSFAYTVGLFGLDHPELLIFGVGPETAFCVLNQLSERVRAGDDLVPGQLITFADWWHRVVPEQVPNPGAIAHAANRYYQRHPDDSVPVLQLSYDDRAGHFPWEGAYCTPQRQPRPGTFQA